MSDDREETLVRSLEHLDGRISAFEENRRALDGETAASRVLELVLEYERLVAEGTRLFAFGELSFASDTRSQSALTCRNRVQQKMTELRNRTLFFSLWWQGLSEPRAIAVLTELRSDRHSKDPVRYLEELRRLGPYRLEEGAEQIINLKDADGMTGILTLYSMITNGFEFYPEIEGACQEGQGLTRDQLMAYVHSADAGERAASYRELFRVYQQHAGVLAQMYVHRVRDWQSENVKLRGYPSAISVRNVANDIPGPAVETLLRVVREKAPLFRRYFERKAEWLGLERLRRCDIYAPLAGSSEEVAYADGVEMVLETFSGFDEGIGAMAKRVFEQNHVDSENRPGKKGGAFCATVTPQLSPWVLVNYSGRLRDVATLAHEMGHAVHSLLASGHSILTQQPSLPMAETASVFAEILVTSKLLDQAEEPLSRRELLASALDDIYATVLRQAYFVLFEIEAHQAILEGRSPDDLHQLYRDNLEEQFGGSVEISDEFATEWLAIPHIYSTPFYCYAYSFGQLLVLALYQRFLEQGEAFKPSYLKILSYGGAARPEEILGEAGIDITDPEFWRSGFDFVEQLLEQLEEISDG